MVISLCFFQDAAFSQDDQDDIDLERWEQGFQMPPVEAFIARWKPSGGSELGSSQSFILELCDILDVPKPASPRARVVDNSYAFEAQVEFTRPDGSISTGRIDLYKKGFFIWESKQGSQKASKAEREKTGGWRVGTAVRDTPSWDSAMIKAHEQAMEYAAGIPKEDGRPPFVIVADIGWAIRIFSDFNNTGVYTPYPSAREYRISLEDLRREEIRERLRLIWTNPLALDPAREREKVTLGIASELGGLAKSLEDSGHNPEEVSRFIMKLIFTFFAEDTNLLPAGYFADILERLESPEEFQAEVSKLWVEIRGRGAAFPIEHPIRRFHSLFAVPATLPVNDAQLELLRKAARANWAAVDPPIFGTLLERALNSKERHQLGAHYTPTAYVERLVYPTIMEPLRAEWNETVRRALAQVNGGDHEAAVYEIRQFHKQLGQTYVLDPSSGSGNFLAAALNAMKTLEAEVITALKDLGQSDLDIIRTGYQVSPHQFRGIDISPHAASIAELVVMISYVQKHHELYGNVYPPEPTPYDCTLVERRDALLAWDREETDGGIKVTPRRAASWPAADFIIGNPPFIGSQKMRKDLGDDYVDALRKAWPEVPASADFCMYWWHHAASLVREGKVRRFGLISTNSISQIQNRQVVENHLSADPPLSLTHAIPSHPWQSGDPNAAKVRIAMTVGELGSTSGILSKVIGQSNKDGQELIYLDGASGKINSDLTIGANIGDAAKLESNEGLSSPGVKINGAGFLVKRKDAEKLGLGRIPGLEKHIRHYSNGRDVSERSRNLMVIDLYGLDSEEVKRRYPDVYQWVLEKVKPMRDRNRNTRLRKDWWLFEGNRNGLRQALEGLDRYIVTPETTQRRYFVFLDKSILPDNALVAFASDDAYMLGILSSRIHNAWIMATGGRLGDRDAQVYSKTSCFDKFPFPDASEHQKERIRDIAERLDAHRKQRQAEHPELTLASMYAVMEDLYYGVHLDPKKEAISRQGDIPTLLSLHKELDRAVAEAYGWPVAMPADEILSSLVELNQKRAAEEKSGQIKWLRPEFQTQSLNDRPGR